MASAGHVEVAVADRGPGFPSEMLSQLYKPFCTTKPRGLGIGLAICRSIITAHGGQLFVENHPQRGAIVRFSLKVHSEQDS